MYIVHISIASCLYSLIMSDLTQEEMNHCIAQPGFGGIYYAVGIMKAIIYFFSHIDRQQSICATQKSCNYF